MGSVGARNRSKKERTKARAQEVAASRTAPGACAPAARPKYQRRVTGLAWLFDLGALDGLQKAAGERYGRDYRFAILESGMQLRSSLDFEERGGGGSRGGAPGLADASHLIVEAREAITLARASLGFSERMILACDLVCGREQTPRDISKVQREAEQIVTTLQVALDLLVKHYAEQRGRFDGSEFKS